MGSYAETGCPLMRRQSHWQGSGRWWQSSPRERAVNHASYKKLSSLVFSGLASLLSSWCFTKILLMWSAWLSCAELQAIEGPSPRLAGRGRHRPARCTGAFQSQELRPLGPPGSVDRAPRWPSSGVADRSPSLLIIWRKKKEMTLDFISKQLLCLPCQRYIKLLTIIKETWKC